MEAHLGRGAKQRPYIGRVLLARQLDENTVAANPLDGWFGNTHLIHALANDFKALGDGLRHAMGKTRLGRQHAQGVRACRLDRQIACGQCCGLDLIGDAIQLADRLLHLGRIRETNLDGALCPPKRGNRNLALFEGGPHILLKVLQPFRDQ